MASSSELITEKEELLDKETYYNAIISMIIRVGSAPGNLSSL